MRKLFWKGALAGVALMVATTASAITIDFTTFVANSLKGSETYSNGMVSVTATPFAPVTSNLQLAEATSPAVTSGNPGSYRGLGVRAEDPIDRFINADEGISFSIPVGYIVTSVTLSRTGTELEFQSFTAFVDATDVGGGTQTVSLQNNVSTDGRTEFNLSSVTGSLFVVTADSGNNKGLWINSLELEQVGSVVPLPAGIVLLGGALVAGSYATRRKKS